MENKEENQDIHDILIEKNYQKTLDEFKKKLSLVQSEDPFDSTAEPQEEILEDIEDMPVVNSRGELIFSLQNLRDLYDNSPLIIRQKLDNLEI